MSKVTQIPPPCTRWGGLRPPLLQRASRDFAQVNQPAKRTSTARIGALGIGFQPEMDFSRWEALGHRRSEPRAWSRFGAGGPARSADLTVEGGDSKPSADYPCAGAWPR